MWATIWLSGAVVMTMGFEGMTADQCEQLRAQIDADIEAGIVEEDDRLWVETTDGDMMPWEPWEVTCEPVAYAIETVKNMQGR